MTLTFNEDYIALHDKALCRELAALAEANPPWADGPAMIRTRIASALIDDAEAIRSMERTQVIVKEAVDG